jgi:hypothetical protein
MTSQSYVALATDRAGSRITSAAIRSFHVALIVAPQPWRNYHPKQHVDKASRDHLGQRDDSDGWNQRADEVVAGQRRYEGEKANISQSPARR